MREGGRATARSGSALQWWVREMGGVRAIESFPGVSLVRDNTRQVGSVGREGSCVKSESPGSLAVLDPHLCGFSKPHSAVCL